MRGISFKYTQGYGDLFNKIFDNLSLLHHEWYIFEDEIIESSIQNNLKLPKKLIGTEFLNIVLWKKYLVISSNIQVYPTNTEQTKILSYQDFLDSKCVMCALITDCEFVEIYAKEREVITQIKINAEKNGFKEIEYITDENDFRTRLSVI